MLHQRHARALLLWAAGLALVGALAIAAPASADAPRSKSERAFLFDMVGHHAMAIAIAEMAREDMRMLEEARGPEFEVRFMAMMSVHHTQAIERARAVRRSPLHRKVRKLTRDIISAQQREIGQMQEWLVAWYAN